MGPEITTAVAIVGLIEKMGGWSVGGVLVCFAILPTLFVFLAARTVAKALIGLKDQMAISEMESQKRFLAFEAKYDNNIRFVEDYARMANGLDDILQRNTRALTKMVDRIDTEARLRK